MKHQLLTSNYISYLLKTTSLSPYASRRMIQMKLKKVTSDTPDVDLYKIKLQNKFFLTKIENYEQKSLDKLLLEGGLGQQILLLPYIKKKRFLNVDINHLKKNKVLDQNADVLEKLLSNLEPFPFEPKKLCLYSHRRSPFLTIRTLRDEIEKQYLAWRLGVKCSVIRRLLSGFSNCLSYTRTISSLKEHMDLLNQGSSCSLSTDNKVYLVTMKPLCQEIISSFKDNIVGLPWFEAALLSPLLISRPYHSILLFLDALKSKGFTDNQIKLGLPYFRAQVPYLIFRLNKILLSSRYEAHKGDDHFLSLLSLNGNVIKALENENWSDLSECVKFACFTQSSKARKFNCTELFIFISRHLKITQKDLDILYRKRHWKWEAHKVEDTIKFLKENFSPDEIIESIPIILHSRSVIEFWLNYIKDNPKIICETGIIGGFAPAPTNTFKHGTKYENKILQLCLYFIDKNEHRVSAVEDLAEEFA